MEKYSAPVLNKRVVLKSLSAVVLVVALIFTCAGKWLFWQGILYCVLMISMR